MTTRMEGKMLGFPKLKSNPWPGLVKISEKTKAPNTAVGTYFSQRSTTGGNSRCAKNNSGSTLGKYDTKHIPSMAVKMSL